MSLAARSWVSSFDAYVDFFEDIYLKAGVLPGELFPLESLERPGLCLDRSDGKPEGVMLGNAKMPEGPLGLRDCGAAPMQQWHVGNRKDDGECCSGLRGMLSDQCVAIRGGGMRTAVCSIDGSDRSQKAELVARRHSLVLDAIDSVERNGAANLALTESGAIVGTKITRQHPGVRPQSAKRPFSSTRAPTLRAQTSIMEGLL